MRPETLVSINGYLRWVRNAFYFGSWDELKKDLKSRLKGDPFIFKWDPPPGHAWDDVLDYLDSFGVDLTKRKEA